MIESFEIVDTKGTNMTTTTNETSGMIGNQTNQTGQGGNETQQGVGQLLEQIGVNEKLANEFAYNGTSFDKFLKEKLILTYGKDYILNNAMNRSAEAGMIEAVNNCMSPLGQAFGGTLCDFGLSTVYEICQALPEATFICASPDIGNHLANRNITEGQTDKIAWLFIGSRETLADVYSQNSTS